MATAILPIISGLAGLFGGAPKTTTTNSNQQGTSNSSQSGTTSGSSTPNLSAIQQLLAQITGSTAINNLTNPQNTFGPNSPYAASGLQTINQNANNAQIIAKNLQAQNGTEYSPYSAYAQSIPQNARVAQSTQFQEQLPLLAQQMQTQNLQNAMNVFGPVGTSSTGTTSGVSNTASQQSGSQTGTSTSPNQMLPGLFSGIGAGGAASGLFPTVNNNQNNYPSTGGNGSANLSNLFKMFGLG